MDKENSVTAEGGERIAGFKERLDNFWYHYKWHTLVSVVVVILFTMLILQTCSRAGYDVHVLYAGSHRFARTSPDGDLPPYNAVVRTLGKFTKDYDGDGTKSVDLRDLYVMTSEEISDLLAENPEAEINQSLIIEDSDTLASSLIYSEYFLIFISDDLFRGYEAKYESALFEPIKQYTDIASGIEYEYASDYGIYLRSLPFYEEPEICKLPDDTVVCVRKLSEVSSTFDKDTNTVQHERAVEMLRSILADK